LRQSQKLGKNLYCTSTVTILYSIDCAAHVRELFVCGCRVTRSDGESGSCSYKHDIEIGFGFPRAFGCSRDTMRFEPQGTHPAMTQY
jgi:hypothetical protein